MDMDEIWRSIANYEGYYEVSNLGRIRRIKAAVGTKPGRILTPVYKHDGYTRIRLYKETVWKSIYIHRLVAVAFLGDPPTLEHQPNHLNGVRDDNRADNLEWATRSENLIHSNRVLHRYNPYGEYNHNTKLSDNDVREIRQLYADKVYNQVQLGKRFNVSQACIWRIVKDKSRLRYTEPKTTFR
jgi:hypothetical protein